MQQGELALAVGADAARAVSVLSTTAAPPGIPSQAVLKVPAELRASRVKGAIMSNPEVKAVVPNRVVRIAQAISGELCLVLCLPQCHLWKFQRLQAVV